MLSPRRTAQLGLGAACLILVSSVAVLVAGAADNKDITTQTSETTAALSAKTTGSSVMSLGMTQTMAVAERR